MNLDGAVTAPAAGSGSAAVPAAAAQDGPGGKPASGPADYVYEFDRPPSVPRPELTRLLGGKAANLVDMATGLGLPVPPGFTIATTACNSYLTAGWPPASTSSFGSTSAGWASGSAAISATPIVPCW